MPLLCSHEPLLCLFQIVISIIQISFYVIKHLSLCLNESCQFLEQLKQLLYALLQLEYVPVLILNIVDCILYFLMRRPNHLLPDYFLSRLGVPCELVQFLLCGVPLCNFELPLDLALHGVLELSLNLLRLSEHVPELGSERPVDSLLDPSLWLGLVGLLGLINVLGHHVQLFLDLLLELAVYLHYFVYLLSAHLLVSSLVISNLLISNLPHLLVLLVHIDNGLLHLLRLDEEVLDELPVVVLFVFVHDERLIQLQTHSLTLCESAELFQSVQHF
ncbi:hypothetical protein FGO68_gene2839 [Halteria grandinella]|uniref:Uncharacterized protein n=1 Tax=Halteria grandinella TaxID=5974 RepID=A0A8J8NMB0_HALGN|nr:hypothetical protein FGO68_gene2839 [Halteria grandinella]